MNFLLASFLAPIFYGAGMIIESQLSIKTFKHPTTMIFYISLMNAVFLPLILFLGTPSVPDVWEFGFYMILAAIDIVYLYPFYMSLKVMDTSIVEALYSLGAIIIPVLTWLLLDEHLEMEQYIGFGIIVMSSVALSIKGRVIPKLSKAFYFVLFSSFLRALYLVLEKYILEKDINWINVTIYPNLISGFLPLAFLFVKKWRKDIFRNFPPYLTKFKLFAINEFLCFLGLICTVYALSGISAVVNSAIAAMQPIFMLMISYCLLKRFGIPINEKISLQIMEKKLFCFVLIVLGVILVVNN
ncbi:MAG: EamA family transporter [Alphaproteobacteria bacterium]|nr:EamA family transporter [Alphaproteobacteria bacterium]